MGVAYILSNLLNLKENYLEKTKEQGWNFQFLNGMKYAFITVYINVLLCIFHIYAR